jgi:hypothetical protein
MTTGISSEGAELGGTLRLTWVTDDLAHVLEHSRTDEPSGTWTGLACPDYGLEIGSDVDEAKLQQISQGALADFVWEASADFTADHSQPALAAIRAYQEGKNQVGEDLWQQAQVLWSRAWSANCWALGLTQAAGVTRFCPDKPQRWVIASFEHHCGPHGVAHPHVHNIVATALTTGTGEVALAPRTT